MLFIVHEDAAPYGKEQSVNVLQWGPLLTRGSDMESRFVHHNYIHKEGSPAETAQRAWGKFWEEVDLMLEGCGTDGEPFAKDEDGTVWKFVFTFSLNTVCQITDGPCFSASTAPQQIAGKSG